VPPLRAGVAQVPLDPSLGGAMMGYGARAGVAESVADPLFARALALEAEGGALLWVELDVCLIAPAQAEAARQRIAARTGVPADAVLVACIHTHSGPDTGLASLLGAGPPPADAARGLAAAGEAAARAHAAAAPARLGWGRAAARIGRNRRVAGGPVDPEVAVLRIDRADGAPLAVLYVHGCHPTVLGHDNLAYSADWPGAASRTIEAARPGALAMFALGAHADVDPRTRGLLDLAVSGQSLGASYETMEALGREVGTAVADAVASIETREDAAVAAATVRVALPVHGAAGGAEAREAALEAGRRRALAALDLDPELDPDVGTWFRLASERTAHLPPDAARPRVAAVRTYLRDRTAPRFAGGVVPEVAVQVLRIGPAWLLALPIEATVEVGLDWKARLGGAPGGVLSIANGWLRYLPHPRHFRAPEAESWYEVAMSTFVPDAAERLLAAGEALRTRLSAR
jgi:neutral ceramidase